MKGKHSYAVGDRVRMLETITAGPTEELPCDEELQGLNEDEYLEERRTP